MKLITIILLTAALIVSLRTKPKQVELHHIYIVEMLSAEQDIMRMLEDGAK